MLELARSSLRARRTSMAGALVAVALAVAFVVSCGVLLESSLNAPIAVHRLAGASVVVQGDPTLGASTGASGDPVLLTERRRVPDELANRLASIPGVRAAVADRSFAVEMRSAGGHVLGDPAIGHGWASSVLTPVGLQTGTAPRGARDIVVSGALAASVDIGDRVDLVTAAGRSEYTVAGIATPSGAADADLGDAVFFRDDVARTLAGKGALADLIGVVTDPGADPHAVAADVRRAIDSPETRVLTGAERGDAESPHDALSREDIVAGLTIFGALAAFVALLVVSSTFALAVRQRHREVALLRAVGMTPRQVRRMIAGEALLVALFASVIGVPLGLVGAMLEKGLFVRADMLHASLEVRFGLLPCVAGVAVAILTTQAAAFASSRRASRIRPVDALREARIERAGISWLRALAGMGLAALAAGVLIISARHGGGGPDDTGPAAIPLLLLAASLLAPLLARPFVAVLGAPLKLVGGASGSLARANLRTDLGRVAAVATPVMLAAGLAFSFVGAKLNMQGHAVEQSRERTTADYALQAHGSTALPPGFVAAAARIDGVAAISGSFATSVAAGRNPFTVPARAVDPATLTRVLDIGVTRGSLAALTGASLAAGTDTAQHFGWHIGDRVPVWLGDGTPVTLRVAAIYSRPLGFAEVLLPRALAERHVTTPVDDLAFVRQRAGSVPLAGLERLAREHSDVSVLSPAQYVDGVRGAATKQALGIYLLLGLIGAFCAVAVVNSMTMAIAGRAQELALIKQVGATRRQLVRMVRAEAAVTVAFGIAVGVLVALPVPHPPFWLYGAVLAGFATLALVACVGPMRLVLRDGRGGPVATRD